MPLPYLPEWTKYTFEYLKDHLDDQKDIDVVDIGFGVSTHNLRRLGFNPLVIDQCVRKNKEQVILNDYTCDLCQTIPIELNNKCDVIVCCNVLEHVVHPFKIMVNLSSLLKPSGRIILMVPSIGLVYHNMPLRCGDYWRYLPGSIELLIQDTSLHMEHQAWCKHPEQSQSFLGGIATLRKGDKQ